jgi:thiol-disulfide isomerase/thioredoxin
MRNTFRAATIVALGVLVSRLSATEVASTAPRAPEPAAIARWINSNPLTLEGQRGKVVVLHFWTFGCINCRHNLPYYNQWRKDFPEEQLEIVGVHTPETDGEADEENVVAQVKQLGVTYPVAIDNDRATWQAYKNRFWPAIYLIDKSGRVRYRWDGELEYKDAGGDRKLRSYIKKLLAEDSKP